MFNFSLYIQVILPVAFIMSFLFSALSIPPIVKIAKKNNLLVYPNHRDSHKGGIPRLGGLAIFIAIVFSLIFFSGINTVIYFRSILTAIIILFFIGLLDDLDNIISWKKLIWEIIAASLVIFGGNMYFTDLYGFMGIHRLYYIPAVLISILVYISVINAFNLVDGIDGLASGLCIQIGLFFGIFFYISGDNNFAVTTAIVTGATFGFYLFNVYSKQYKIFMGDSGSLVLGFLIGLMVWRFCSLNLVPSNGYHIQAAPAVAMGFLTIPLFDTLRVMTLRIWRKKSPFVADRQHVHHILLDLGFSHAGVRRTLILFNIAMSLLALTLQYYFPSVLFIILILLLICLLFTFMLFKIKEKRKHTNI